MKTKTKIPQVTSIYIRYLHQHDGMNISNIVRQYAQYISIYRHCTRKPKKLNSKNDRKIIWKIQRFQEQFGDTFTANRVKYISGLTIVRPPPPPPPPQFCEGGGELTLPKIPRKGGWKNCWRIEGILRRGDSVSLGIFSSWGAANVTTATFNDILVSVPISTKCRCQSLFSLYSLAPVYRVYTSCFHNTVVSSCHRLHTSCLHHGGVTSCFSLKMWF